MAKVKRKIIQIDEDKCDGCGLCVSACHEGAIQLIDGKAKLVSESYCDGLGDCLPACPRDAIHMVEKEAQAYDEAAVQALMAQKQEQARPMGGGCPSAMQRTLHTGCPSMRAKTIAAPAKESQGADQPSALGNWPVQLRLINPSAPYLAGADLLIAADCVAYAYGNFHKDFTAGRVTIIGCPKLDDTQEMTQRLTAILEENDIRSITCVRMEVPCCGGITASVRKALVESGSSAMYKEVVIGIEGDVVG